MNRVLERHHADTLQTLTTCQRPATETHPASVDVDLRPAGKPIRGITDPSELRAMAWLLLAVAGGDPIYETTIYDHIEATP